jgi:hypothetical protein
MRMGSQPEAPLSLASAGNGASLLLLTEAGGRSAFGLLGCAFLFHIQELPLWKDLGSNYCMAVSEAASIHPYLAEK